MRLLILFVSTWVLASAKPGTYREKEDFEYSRSSSDDGSKSGYYGAQRGNMGGNYEHAHNMDGLAQHQMSTLVRQVDGELGTGANTRTGSVYTAGNSRGIYGSGSYDLTNLKGRNFGESNSFGGSQSHSSMSSNSGSASSLGYGQEYASSNAQYSSSQSQRARHSSEFQSAGQSSSDLLIGGQQAETLHSDLQSEYDNQAANNNYKLLLNAQGSNIRNNYEENMRNGYDSNTQTRYISGNPVKIYVRPGTRVTIPVSAQTYDASHFNALHDQNSIHSDAEILSTSGREVHLKPITKHYESSYKYKKEWEKHDTQTIVPPTENPFPQNNEFYDNAQISQDSQHQDSFDINHQNSAQLNKINSAYSNGYNAGSKSSSSHQSRYQSGSIAESQNSEAAMAASHSKDYLHDGSTGNIVENINSSKKPKHYQSSYSYHKAWERQGDPYVIEPASTGSGSGLQTSQRLSAASENYGHASSYQHGSHYSQSQQRYSSDGSLCCNENGHIRVARSYNTNQEPSEYQNNFEQQSQNDWANTEDFGQQTQENLDKFSDFGQETQNKWDHLEHLEQQTQDNWDNLHDLSQQQQNKWENQEELGQKSQNIWENLDLENAGQHPQRNVDKIDLGHQVENKNDKENVEQMPPNTWKKLEELERNLNGQPEKHVGLQSTHSEQELEHKWLLDLFDKSGNFRQQAHNGWNKQDGQYQGFNPWFNLQDINQQNLENGQVRHTNYPHLHSHQYEQLFGHSETFGKGGSNVNTGYITSLPSSWAPYPQENENKKYKEFSDFWNLEHSNVNYWQHGLNLDSKQQTPEFNNYENLWEKLEKMYNNSQTQKNNANEFTVNNKISETTEQSSNTQKVHIHSGNSNTIIIPQKESNNTQDKTNTDKANKDSNVREIHIIQPMDIGRGDIGPEDEIISAVHHKNNNLLVDSINEKTTEKIEYHNLHKNKNSTEPHDQSFTTEDSIDMSVMNVDQNIQYQNTDYKTSSTLKEESTTEVINHPQHHNMIASDVEQTSENLGQQTIDQQSEDFGQQNMDQQLEDFGQQNMDQQLEDFGQQNMNQKLEDFGQKNMDQHLEDFGQQNMDQQSEDLGRQDINQKLEDFGQKNMDQQLEDFAQQNMNQKLDEFGQKKMDQQSEDFGQQNMDQQSEDFGQQNMNQKLEDIGQKNVDQQLEDFGEQNMNQKFEDFEQKNMDQQLEVFGQENMNQKLEDFGQKNMDQQLEDFGQQNMNQKLEDFGQKNMDQQLEDFGQQNMKQQAEDFGHKNMDQQLEDFKQINMDQQLEDFGQQNMNQQLEDFSQQNMDQQLEDMGQMNQVIQSQTLENFKEPKQTSQNVQKYGQTNEFEVNHATHNNYNKNIGQQQQNSMVPEETLEQLIEQVFEEPKGRSPELVVPEEPVTEKSGFWASVGNKLNGAKTTVTGWFKRS